MRRPAGLGLCLVLVSVASEPATAQLPELPELSGYYLHVGLWSGSNPITPGGLSDLQRLRIMAGPRLGPVDLEIAYEHLLTWTQKSGAGAIGTIFAEVAPSGGEWLDLQWTPERSRHWEWRHRFDRLRIELSPASWLAIAVGRQAISWATTLLLTPADPFTPFDPSDPFREYRAGVDALRVRAFTGPFSELELVVRPSETPAGETITGLLRGRTLILGWEASGWAGTIHDGAGLGLGASGALGPTALRFEGSLRDEDDGWIPRFTLGIDRRFSLLDRDLYAILEYQHDEFGADDEGELLPVITSEPLARGELQVLGQDVAVVSASYRIHPLWTGDLLVLWNPGDRSVLWAPGLSHSVSDEATARLGLFVGNGDETDERGLPRSEFGPVPLIVYASASLFF